MRIRKLVEPGLQLRLSLVLVSCTWLAALFQVQAVNRALVAAAEGSAQGGDVLAALPGIMTRNLLLTLGVVCPLLLVVGVVVSHRIAGAAYRIEQHLRAHLRGEEVGPLRLRRRDELQRLAEVADRVIATHRIDGRAPAPASAPGAAVERAA